MRRLSHRFPLSQVSRLMFAITFGLIVLTLTACGGSGSKTESPVAPVVSVAVSPTTFTLGVNTTQTFTATVTGSSNTAVTWSVTETTGGVIDSTGKYTAAAKAGTYHVVATSQASPSVSNKATVIVTAPAPTFTSSAPLAAVEGGVYSYDLTATGTSNVTFTLTSSPVGATLSGSTISWTPTALESRVNNSFAVTATTDAGGTNSQSWTVNPNGTIRISSIDTYWSANGPTQKANDLNQYFAFAALAPNQDGSFTNIPGTGNADGTVTIANVPAGFFWLSDGDGSSYWTNSSTFDLGEDLGGREPSSCDYPATLALNLSGLASLTTDSWLTVSVPNLMDEIGFADLPLESSSYVGDVQFYCPIDPALGDTTYIVQAERVTGLGADVNGTLSGPALSLPSLAAPGGTTTEVSGELTTANPQSLDFKVQWAEWAASFKNVAPTFATLTSFMSWVDVQLYVSDRATHRSASLVNAWPDSVQSSNTDYGTIHYNNPYPSSWSQVFSGFAEAGGDDYRVFNAFATTTPLTGGFAPLISAVQSPTMNGSYLFINGVSSDTTSVAFRWNAPTGLTPYGYAVSYQCEACWEWSEVYTSSTSVTFPPGLLEAGESYRFQIIAMADSKANIATSPWRSGYPMAMANVVSATLLIDANATSAPILGEVAVPLRASKNPTLRTKEGRFLVTKNGNKPIDSRARMRARFNQRRSAPASTTGSAVK